MTMELLYLGAAAFVTLLLLWLRTFKNFMLGRKMPPRPVGWLIIGSMLELPVILSNPRKFEQMVERHGPIFTVWNGQVPTILISGQDIAHEVLVHKGSRPEFPSLKAITNGFRTVNAAPYGHHWRTIRRNLVSGLLSPKSMSDFACVQEKGVENLLKVVESESHRPGGTVLVSVLVRRTLLGILSFICFGQHLDDERLEKLDSLMKEAIRYFGPEPGDLVPGLRFLSWRKKRKVKEFVGRHRELLGGLISETVRNHEDPTCTAHGPQCYVQTLVSLQETSDVDLDLTILVRELFIAGADTTTTTVEWVMANLVNQQQVQQKVLDELHEKVGKGRFITVEDLPKLSYLDAVVKEALRRHPPVYVTAPHVPTEDSTLAGYHIPVGSVVLVHIQRLNHDRSSGRKGSLRRVDPETAVIFC